MSFVLKRINHANVLERYLSKTFQKIEINKTIIEYEKNISGKKIIFSDSFVYDETVEIDVKCNWCSEFCYKSGMRTKYIPFGVPVEGWYSENDKKYFYKTCGTFCSYECAYAFLNLVKYRNPSAYSESEKLIKILFSQDYPNKILKKANDFWLLREYGGPLRRETWVKNEYKQSNNRVMLPTLNEYNWRNTKYWE